MTDKHKQLNLSDLDLPAKRGRPSSGNALSNADKQRLYRERNKGKGKKHLLLEPLEVGILQAMVRNSMNQPSQQSKQVHDVYAALLQRLESASPKEFLTLDEMEARIEQLPDDTPSS